MDYYGKHIEDWRTESAVGTWSKSVNRMYATDPIILHLQEKKALRDASYVTKVRKHKSMPAMIFPEPIHNNNNVAMETKSRDPRGRGGHYTGLVS